MNGWTERQDETLMAPAKAKSTVDTFVCQDFTYYIKFDDSVSHGNIIQCLKRHKNIVFM